VSQKPKKKNSPGLLSNTLLSWSVSIVLHGSLAAFVIWLPTENKLASQRPNIEIIQRKLPEIPPPPLPDPIPKAADSPVPKVQAPTVRSRVTKARSRATPPQAKAEPKHQPTDTAENTGPQTFGIQMSGTTSAAPGQGVQIPEGQSLSVSPKITRRGKPRPQQAAPRSSGFKSHYAPGEEAPTAALTTEPRVLKKIAAEYPEKMKELGIEGRVVLEIVVNAHGRVAEAKILKSLHPQLDAVALTAVKQMLFRPATVNGAPVTTKIPYTFTFVLD
jgi:TonB family protein